MPVTSVCQIGLGQPSLYRGIETWAAPVSGLVVAPVEVVVLTQLDYIAAIIHHAAAGAAASAHSIDNAEEARVDLMQMSPMKLYE